MKLYGLIGYPLSHSFSQRYFTEKFKREGITDCHFRNFEIKSISELKSLLESNQDLCGLSVTIPHKETIIPLLDNLSSEASAIGAVNCVKISKGAKGHRTLEGYNTDVVGFGKSLSPLLGTHHTKALILGTGGASKAVAKYLDMSKIYFRHLSRFQKQNIETSKTWSYGDLSPEIIAEYSVIINTTPLGMHPETDKYPDIPYQAIGSKHLLFDLIYNPEETIFLRKGREQGAETKNGLEMLELQAEAAWKIWNS